MLPCITVRTYIHQKVRTARVVVRLAAYVQVSLVSWFLGSSAHLGISSSISHLEAPWNKSSHTTYYLYTQMMLWDLKTTEEFCLMSFLIRVLRSRLIDRSFKASVGRMRSITKLSLTAEVTFQWKINSRCTYGVRSFRVPSIRTNWYLNKLNGSCFCLLFSRPLSLSCRACQLIW